MLLSTVLGGVAGSAATIYWTNTQRPASISQSPASAAAPQMVASRTTATNISAIYQKLSPAVVSIVTSNRSRGSFQGGEGTGFIVSDQGYILTNNHVVQSAAKITVTLLDGTQLDATVAGADPASDLALLKANIPNGKIAVASLGDSDQVQPGELAIAIGNPFGLDHSVTSGIISAVGREFGTASGRPMRGLIQTDAPVNPGNSGGPLIDAEGQVIGITTSIESPIQGSVGLGFAIPINRAKGLIPELQSGQAIQHAYLGIQGGDITVDFAQTHSLPVTSGVWVTDVVPNGPAAKAGLRGSDPNDPSSPVTGDIITEVDGKPIKTIGELSGYLDTKAVGDNVTLTVVRDGNTIKVNVTLGTWPA